MALSRKVSVLGALLATGLVIAGAQAVPGLGPEQPVRLTGSQGTTATDDALLGSGTASGTAAAVAATEADASAHGAAAPPVLRGKWARTLEDGSAIGAAPAAAEGLVVLPERGGALKAYRQDTGASAWQTAVSELGSASAPAVVQGGLLTTVTNAIIQLDTATGATRWTAPIAGLGTPPSVDGDTAYVAAARLHAIDVSTGRQRWTADIGRGTSSSTPAVDAGVGLVVVASVDGTVHGINTADGTTRWTARTSGAVHAPVRLVDGVVLVPGGDGALTALDMATGAVRWARTLATPEGGFHSRPAAAAGTAYAQAADGTIFALDIATGVTRWQVSTYGDRNEPVLAPGALYVLGADQQKNSALLVLDPATGALLSSYSTGEPGRGKPTLAGPTLFVPTPGKLLSITVS